VTGNAAIDEARDIATRLHAGQLDKLGEPYVGHCERVAARLHDDAKVVALLHDILEDTGMPESDLRAAFGHRIVDAVVLLTRAEQVEAQEYYAKIRKDPLARSVKLADIHDNLDPARLSKLDAKTASRLLRKYGAALVALGSE
jgi:(p)ppGpp synthase/HD superfamily hydrolase